MKDIIGMMKQAKAMQEKMQDLQQEIAEISATGQSGGGLVTVKLNGRTELASLVIDPSLMVADENSEAMRKIRRLEEEIMALQDARMVSSDRARAASDAVVGAFNSAAERLEGITRKLNVSRGSGVGIG